MQSFWKWPISLHLQHLTLMLPPGRVVGYFSFFFCRSNFSMVAVNTFILSFCGATCCRAWLDCCCTFLWVILYPASMLFAASTAAFKFPGVLAYTISAIVGFSSLKNCRIVLVTGVLLFGSTFFWNFLKRLPYSLTDSVIPCRQFR